MRRVVCACAAAVGIASPVVGVASGAGWSLQRLPSAVRGFNGRELDGVACPSRTTCTAFGSYLDTADNAWTLAIRFSGARWSLKHTPTPRVGAGGIIETTALACPSVTACVAVGSYDAESGRTLPFAELSDGGHWRLRALPEPTGAYNVFVQGVSCTSRSACVAVGVTNRGPYSRVSATLAERWDGRRWTIQRTPNPASTAELHSVSCTSREACIAVGEYVAKPYGGGRQLIERWDGKRWSIQNTPTPKGWSDSHLRGVSCTSTSCVAVGYFANRTYDLNSLVERSDGGRWSVMAVPNPPNSQGGPSGSLALSGELDSVSCASQTACVAVGAVVGRWDGSRWSIERPPTPGGFGFVGVSCPAATTCAAVGNAVDPLGNPLAYVERWTAN